MKQSILILIIIFAYSSVKSQIESLDSVTFHTYIPLNKQDVYFSIMKRNNPKELINDYKAFLVISKKDTIYLFNDSIITRNFNYNKISQTDLVVFYKSIKYEIPKIEYKINGIATNIYFIINKYCVGNNYIIHDFHDIISYKSKSDRPDIYIRDFISTKVSDTIPNSEIIRINHKKNKYIIPNW